MMRKTRKQNPDGYPLRGKGHLYFHNESEFWRFGLLFRVVPGTNRKIACTSDGLFLGANLLKPRKQSSGYLWVSYKNELKLARNVYCHRAVALCWLDNTYDRQYVNHINGDKHDNHYWNLEWVTAKENTKHAIRTGLVNNLPSKGEAGFRTRSQVIAKST